MAVYAERRKGKLTGWWYGQADVQVNGAEVRFRRRFKTKGEAGGWTAYVKATGQEPPGLTETPAGSFAELARAFTAHTPTWGARDHSARQRLAWVVDRIGRLDIRAVTTGTLDKLVVDLRAKGLSNRTINRYLDACACVLTFAHKRVHGYAKPAIPRLENKGEDRLLTLSWDLEDAVCTWLEANRDPRIAFVVRVLAETGMRRSELWKLGPEQVQNETLTLAPEQTKTERARVVPLPADMATQLRAVIAAGALPGDYQVWNAFKQAVKACGGNPDLTLHSLRHTRATRLVEAGVNLRVVAELLGHSNIQTTMKYSHPDGDVLAEAAKKVHQARGGRGEKGAVVHLKTAV